MESNSLFPCDLLRIIPKHTNPDYIDQQVKQRLFYLKSKQTISVRKRYEMWIKNMTDSNRLEEQWKWISDHDQALGFLKNTLNIVAEWHRQLDVKPIPTLYYHPSLPHHQNHYLDMLTLMNTNNK